MMKTLEMTENNLNSIVDVIQGCDVFNADQSPITNAAPAQAQATPAASGTRSSASEKN